MINVLPPFLLGFLALSFQIFLLREFSVHFYGNEITFGLLLASWLLWGGLGSILAKKVKYSPSRFPRVYYGVVLIFPLCLVGLRFSRFLLGLLPGEITGMGPMLVSALLISFFVSFPLGLLFVFNTHFLKGDLSRVYLFESIGASTAGIVVYFIFIPLLSNWHGAALASALATAVVFMTFGRKKHRLLILLVPFYLVFFSLFDFPSQKIFWKPYRLQESRDTPYGKLQMIKTDEQISLYNNTLMVYTYPDLATAEDSVHFALLQKPLAEDVLLVGGGVGGSLREILKYPKTRVDYVEIDPDIIKISLEYLPDGEKEVHQNPRTNILFRDGRAFLNMTDKTYDVIILNLLEPVTAQLNRFYTQEFFSSVKDRLAPDGVFAFRVPSAENYISPELQNFLSSLFYTLKSVFYEVDIIPGGTNVFLASSSPLSTDFNILSQRIQKLHLHNTFVRPEILFARLSSLRVNMLEETIQQGEKRMNLDFVPVSYFYSSVLWSSQFIGLEKRIFSFLADLPPFWLLDLPLLIIIAFLFFLWLRKKTTSYLLVPLAVMGLTTIIFEIIVIITFQTLYGYLYQRVALLLSSFMIGLSLGAFWGRRRKRVHFTHILVLQFGLLLLVLAFYFVMSTQIPELGLFLFLLILGFLGGDLFIIANVLFLEQKKNYGLGYGLDLLGSFMGALVASSILIPLMGLPLLLKYLSLLNSFCLLFLFGGLFRR